MFASAVCIRASDSGYAYMFASAVCIRASDSGWCMCGHTCARLHVCVYVGICVHTYMCAHMHARLCEGMKACMYMCVRVSTHLPVHMCLSAHAHFKMDVHARTCAGACACWHARGGIFCLFYRYLPFTVLSFACRYIFPFLMTPMSRIQIQLNSYVSVLLTNAISMHVLV